MKTRIVEVDGLDIDLGTADERTVRMAVESADEGGTIQAEQALRIFGGGQPEWHEAQSLRTALARLGASITD